METSPKTWSDWEEDYENEKAHFLIYDKQSGSRWLDDERLKSFIASLLTHARTEGREDGMAIQKAAHEANKEQYSVMIAAARTEERARVVEEVLAILTDEWNCIIPILNIKLLPERIGRNSSRTQRRRRRNNESSDKCL